MKLSNLFSNKNRTEKEGNPLPFDWHKVVTISVNGYHVPKEPLIFNESTTYKSMEDLLLRERNYLVEEGYYNQRGNLGVIKKVSYPQIVVRQLPDGTVVLQYLLFLEVEF